MQEKPTAPTGASPDADPAGSGFPPVPTTERHDEPSEFDRGRRFGERLGRFEALAAARRALRQSSAVEVARILNQLVGVEDLSGVLQALEDLADRGGAGR